MASKEPPLIRSSKAFSVQIPEGSNSAKARRSDIVAGELEGVTSIQSHFEEQLATKNQNLTAENESNHANLVMADLQNTQDSFAHAHEDYLSDQLTSVASDGHVNDNVVGIASDAIKDK
jgi:hypothetical protein